MSGRSPCRLPARKRGGRCGTALAAGDVARIEKSLRAMQSCFVVAGRDRHYVRVRRGRDRIHAIYDSRRDRLVSLRPREAR